MGGEEPSPWPLVPSQKHACNLDWRLEMWSVWVNSGWVEWTGDLFRLCSYISPDDCWDGASQFFGNTMQSFTVFPERCEVTSEPQRSRRAFQHKAVFRVYHLLNTEIWITIWLLFWFKDRLSFISEQSDSLITVISWGSVLRLSKGRNHVRVSYTRSNRQIVTDFRVIQQKHIFSSGWGAHKLGISHPNRLEPKWWC